MFSNGEPWVKNHGDENFDVPMGCYDGTEICELIGAYLLYQINNVISKENIGFYRDDGLGIFRNISGPEVERRKKDLLRIFKGNGLSITVKINLKIDFLHIHFEIVQDIHQPFKKPNNEPLYINKNSNHPQTVIKQIPKAISKRISDISSSEEIYDQNINYYKDTLKHSEYDNISLPYNPSQQKGQDKIENEKRKRKMIWFNAPFSMNLKTNVGKTVIKPLQCHFQKRLPMHKIFNRNMVNWRISLLMAKRSYFCMRNMESVTSSHNKQSLNPSKEYFGCNRRVRNECPLVNK